jgi:hypothetical protein
MDTKHTPGPWHTAGQEQVQIRSEKHQIAKAWCFAGKTGQANARLIAAAPTMLKALQDAEMRIRSYPNLLQCDEEFKDRETEIIRAAIATATKEN